MIKILKSRADSVANTKANYDKDLEKSRANSAVRTKANYDKDLEKSHADSAVHSKDHYKKDIEISHTLKRQRYVLNCVCSLHNLHYL